MAKKQTRRSISVSRSTYERLKAYCETNGISMSHFVESRVGDYLGRNDVLLSPQRAPGYVEDVDATPSAPTAPTPPRAMPDEDIEVETSEAVQRANQIFTF